MIKVSGLQKSFKLTSDQKKKLDKGAKVDKVAAVRDISFTCQPGRVFTLLGPNGAGKTTTLRMVATMLAPDSGSIEVAGYDTVSQGREVRQRLGFLTGSTGLYDRLNPLEFIKYFADLYKISKTDFEKRTDKIFTLLGIHDFANRRIGRLSTGMKQKVSIARTLIHDPEVVVFDEPTSGLDVISAKSIIQLIRDLRQQGKTVIFSTHIMGEVSLLSDDLAIIHNGQLCYSGTYKDFSGQMQTDSLVDEFIRVIEEAPA